MNICAQQFKKYLRDVYPTNVRRRYQVAGHSMALLTLNLLMIDLKNQ